MRASIRRIVRVRIRGSGHTRESKSVRMADVARVGAAVSRGMSDTARDGATIQVALTGRSGLAADLVRHLLTGQGDIAIVDAPWDAAAAFAVAVNAVDIVVFTDGEDGVPEPCRHLLF